MPAMPTPVYDLDFSAVSLFSGGGVGDLGLRAAGIHTVAASELVPERASLIRTNFPEAQTFEGDLHVTKDGLISSVRERLKGAAPFLVLATPPCQGMSANGAGKLLSNARKGLRSPTDPRNELILPALDVVLALRPRWVVFENVVAMRNTVIEFEGRASRILDVVQERLGPEYSGCAYDVQFADYGLPQRRKRLITVFTREPRVREALRCGKTSLIPEPTHDERGASGRAKWITLRRALSGFPSLDASSRELAVHPDIPLHRVPLLDATKYEWVRHTPEGQTAFSNQCVNPECGYQYNPTHSSVRNKSGINQSRKDTPLYCLQCGSLLPRPSVPNPDGSLRIMSGYTSAYKRMKWDEPASTLTQNLSYACSDNKLHPHEHRVLSLAEAENLQGISAYGYEWPTRRVGDKTIVPESLVRDVIGESVPPIFVELLAQHLLLLSSKGGCDAPFSADEPQLSLFPA